MPSSVAEISWQTSTQEQDRVERAAPAARASAPAASAPLSALLLERQRPDAAHPREGGLGSTARKIEKRNRTTMTARITQSRVTLSRLPDTLTALARVAGSGPAAPAPGVRIAAASSVVAWSKPRRCSTPWTTSSASSSSSGAAVLVRLAAGHRRAHHDVADDDRRIRRLAGAPGPAPALVGLASARRRARRRSGTRARRSGPSPPEEPLVEVGDRLLVDEQQGQLGVAAGRPAPRRARAAARRTQRSTSTATSACSSAPKTSHRIDRRSVGYSSWRS